MKNKPDNREIDESLLIHKRYAQLFGKSTN